MDVFVLLVSCAIVFFGSVVWMKYRRPWRPTMDYRIKRRLYDLPLNILGFWIFLFASGYFESRIIQIPDMRPTFVMCFTRIMSLVITGIFLHFSMTRPTHPGPFALPAVFNTLATIGQYEALKSVSFAEFGAAKSLRVLIVGIYGSKSNIERIAWGIVATLSAKWVFWYEFSRTRWTMPQTIGIVWLLIFILADSYTSIGQEEIYKRFKASNITMMFYINSFMLLLVIPQLFLEEDTLLVTARALTHSPYYILQLILLTTCAVIAQFFALRLIRQYGALSFTVACTFRTLFTVVAAKYIKYGYYEVYEIAEVVVIVLMVLMIIIRRKPWRKDRKNLPKALLSDLMPLVSND